MLISVINRSKIKDEEVQKAIRAINRQIAEDFEPYWSFGAVLRLEGSVGGAPNKKNLSDLRGEAILYLYDKTNVDGALGYHDTNWRGIPYGFVFTELSEQLGESWTVTLSHEALELIGDAQANLLVQGPHPEDASHEVFHWFEMCDAVQSESYSIDGVDVSNFVLPAYFTVSNEPGSRNDFLGRKETNGNPLLSFGVKPGGYVGFYDPSTQSSGQWAAPADTTARKRMAIKGAVSSGRSYIRKNSQATKENEDRHKGSLISALSNLIKPTATVSSSGTTSTNGNQFNHVFVLMLENRSFDQMLGALNKVGINVDGINPKNSNLDSAGKIFRQESGAADRLPANGTDPGHEFEDATEQIADGALNGFVTNFEHVCKSRKVDAAVIEQYKPQIMRYFDIGNDAASDALPVLHTLAKNFVVCDKWFSSLPGPTWPNRAFVHSGTSHGIITMPESLSSATSFRFYPQETIYNKLSSADIDWCIYHSGVSQTVTFPRLWRYLPTDHYRNFEDFEQDLKQSAAKIPQYVFIEPDFFGEDRTDQHPPGSMEAGEKLIANVYDALRANTELWNNSLLVIVWDEHGGFYDHVVPGVTVAPDDCGEPNNFKQLGLRVPALLISPKLKASVSSNQFDHTSLLRYISERWGLPAMGQRAAQANSITQAFQWADHVRTDAETPANLTALLKPVLPDSPQPLTATLHGAMTPTLNLRSKVKASLNVVDAHGQALLWAVQAAAQQIASENTTATTSKVVRGAKPAGLKAKKLAAPVKEINTAFDGKALFAQLTGKIPTKSKQEVADAAKKVAVKATKKMLIKTAASRAKKKHF